MDYNDIGTLVGGVSTGVLALAGLVGVGVVYQDLRIRRLQLKETVARSEASLNVNVEVRALRGRDTNGKPNRVVETRVSLHNNGSDTLAIAALYVSIRGLHPTKSTYVGSVPTGGRMYAYTQSELFATTHVIAPRENIGRVDKGVFQVAPDESEEFAHWGALDEEAANKSGIVVVAVDVFTVAADLIGVRYNPLRVGMPHHAKWTEYINDGARQGFCVFARSGADENGTPKRVLRMRPKKWNGDESTLIIDPYHTNEFADVLRSLVEWNRYRAVSLCDSP
ncbi:hypothetical protein [Polyangium sp. 6x1]|uniref:hypothetical protein n=1 Tax=Polyangium sp. 6x1 TaxID=3042689 RepID=UPI002482FE94|nr:hypothetical protein [Polyangium sp. 6x1]MDI1445957.1 hypothetical protein [Polyangium sp. 6x1]